MNEQQWEFIYQFMIGVQQQLAELRDQLAEMNQRDKETADYEKARRRLGL